MTPARTFAVDEGLYCHFPKTPVHVWRAPYVFFFFCLLLLDAKLCRVDQGGACSGHPFWRALKERSRVLRVAPHPFAPQPRRNVLRRKSSHASAGVKARTRNVGHDDGVGALGKSFDGW
jgi:hypothetical protein